jgi:predicted RNA-binding protein YlxR (DUF448 family)
MCAVCRERKEKDAFFRLVRKTGDEEAALDKMFTMQGRGVYICKNEKCILGAKKTRAISRSLKCCVSDELFDELIRMLKKSERRFLGNDRPVR